MANPKIEKVELTVDEMDTVYNALSLARGQFEGIQKKGQALKAKGIEVAALKEDRRYEELMTKFLTGPAPKPSEE